MTTRRFGNGPRDGREDNYRDDLYRNGQEGHGGHERADYDDAGYDDADYVEYEVVDDDAAAAAGEEYHGSHRRADADDAEADADDAEADADDAEADADDAEADYADAGYEHAGYPERAARTEQAERAGGAGVAEGGSTAVAAGGVPKRGLAMILIAVAALLLLWGIYAMTQRDTSSDTNAEPSASQNAAAPSQSAQGQDAQGQSAQGQSAAPSANQASPANPSAANPSANQANPANPSAANPSAGQDAGQQNLPAAQPNAEGGQGLQASDAEVLVYNNSGVPNAAQETADKLHNQYRVANDSHDVAAMNMPEQNYGVFPETYVFYNPQVAGADKVAADVARQVGGTPRSTKDLPGGGLSLPAQANNPNAITVVIAG